jgi:hypothetical protein
VQNPATQKYWALLGQPLFDEQAQTFVPGVLALDATQRPVPPPVQSASVVQYWRCRFAGPLEQVPLLQKGVAPVHVVPHEPQLFLSSELS